jgi:hypothetical protein
MAYLSEHEAPPQSIDNPEGDNYQPTDEEKKAIAVGEKLFEQAKKFKSKYDERWNDYYNMYRGRQWKDQRPSYKHSDVINLIFREIQSNVPIQMDTRPKFEYLPQEPSDIELADILNEVSEADWVRYNWTAQITEMIYDANIFGTGVGAVNFDGNADNGQGAICVKSEDPFYIFPDPTSKDVNVSSKYFIKAEPLALDEIKKNWANGKYVKSDLVGIKKMDLFDKNKVDAISPTTSWVQSDSSQQLNANEQPEALVITIYFDGAFEIVDDKQEKQLEDGTVEVSFVHKKKYPQGRKLVIANKVVLEDGPNMFEDALFPFARVQNYVSQRQFWGISDVEQLESPQKIFNKLVCFSMDVLTLMGNPIWKVGAGSGVDTDNLFNQPGLIIEADDINQVQREEGVQLQPYVLQLIDRMKLWFDDVSGSSDVSRGANPTGVTAASAIQSLQEATQTRLRQKARNLDACLQNMGQLYMSRVFQFYSAPRIFRLTNKDGSQKFFKFHVETDPQSGQKFARYRRFDQGEDGQMYEGEESVKEIKGLLDVKVSTGSALPFAKAEKEEKLLNLFDRGIIDAEEVLKSTDYPNWEAVLQRVQQNQAMAAQAQQAQGPQAR